VAGTAAFEDAAKRHKSLDELAAFQRAILISRVWA
jgi:accessory colonization factor AcfC